MREILFRGKRTDDGKWVYGFYVSGATRHCIALGLSSPQKYDVVPETVGQYIGLIDKNGKKIFEGDILKHIKNQKICLVCWHASFSQFVIRKKKYNYNSTYDDLFLVKRYYEVIGNIYDNPELLDGEDNEN